MSLHLGNRHKIKRPTDKLFCGVRCKDQFWVTMTQQRDLLKSERVSHGASCKRCLKKFYKGKT